MKKLIQGLVKSDLLFYGTMVVLVTYPIWAIPFFKFLVTILK